MKRFLLALVLLLALAPALALSAAEDEEILSALRTQYPGLGDAVTARWGDTAAAALEYENAKILCVLEKQDGQWRVTLSNPRALARDEPLPSLLLDSDDALYWSYQTYPEIEYTAMRENGVWGGVDQLARSTGGDGETKEDEVFYQDGLVIHNRFRFDKNENMLESSRETLPALWLKDHVRLADFDIDLFPVIGYVEYDGEWPARAFIERTAKELMPDYAFVSGSYAFGRLRFLMDKPDGTRVFVGCGTESVPALVESAPLPRGAYYGVENFTNSLGIGSSCVTLTQDAADENLWRVWYLTYYGTDGSGDELTLTPDWVYTFAYGQTRVCFGKNPWSGVTRIDWETLPKTFSEAVDSMDCDGWALVDNPNPADRLHLRTAPDTGSASLGKYYNGTPVRVAEIQNGWARVKVFGREGYMLEKYLNLSQPFVTTLDAMPQMEVKNGTARLYTAPDEAAAYEEIANENADLYVCGVLSDEWYHVWFLSTGASGFIRQSELYPGNG